MQAKRSSQKTNYYLNEKWEIFYTFQTLFPYFFPRHHLSLIGLIECKISYNISLRRQGWATDSICAFIHITFWIVKARPRTYGMIFNNSSFYYHYGGEILLPSNEIQDHNQKLYTKLRSIRFKIHYFYLAEREERLIIEK